MERAHKTFALLRAKLEAWEALVEHMDDTLGLMEDAKSMDVFSMLLTNVLSSSAKSTLVVDLKSFHPDVRRSLMDVLVSMGLIRVEGLDLVNLVSPNPPH